MAIVSLQHNEGQENFYLVATTFVIDISQLHLLKYAGPQAQTFCRIFPAGLISLYIVGQICIQPQEYFNNASSDFLDFSQQYSRENLN